MSKLLLNKEQKLYMKNYYKNFIDVERKMNKIKTEKIQKQQIQSEKLHNYLSELIKKDEENISNVDCLIFNNIINI